MDMLSRTNTQALRGIAALGILVFHVLLGFQLSPLLNMWGGLFVTVFLVLSGCGLEESYRQNGLGGFWPKRLEKVVLPTVFFICAYNYLFSHVPLGWDTSAGAVVHKCLDELLYVRPSFWFVFFILKCYAVYWVGTRFLGEHWRWLLFVACALLCLVTRSPSGHFEAEQSLSFLAGVVLSMEKGRLRALRERDMLWLSVLLLLAGRVFFGLKQLPALHALKGSVGYHFLLCPFRLTTGLAAIPLLTLLRPDRSRLLQTAGKYSLEIYIAHIPFIRLVSDGRSTLIFLACSALSFCLLLAYRRFVSHRMSLCEVLYVAVNALFVAKYSARVSEHAALAATLGAVVFYCLLLWLAGRSPKPWTKRVALTGCLLAFVAMLAVQMGIDPYGLQVDRWSALHFPIENMLGGRFPYEASTHLGGNASPFPVWQALHVPFYLLGNVGLSLFVAIGFFLWSCRKVQGAERALAVGVLLFGSVAVWYEAAVRSDLLANMLLVASLVNLVLPRLNQAWAERNGLPTAVAVGLLASTRVLVLLPIGLLLFPYLIRLRLKKQVGLTLLALSTFALTFVPFALWDFQALFHLQNAPWTLQTRQGNASDFLLFVPMALLLALNWGGCAKRYYRNSSLMLAAFVGVTFVHNMYLGQNWDLFSPTFDITYFSTVLPFCLLGLAEKSAESQENVCKN